jgi:acetyltransferase-like isoleucine patch superfamily enzyme
MSRASPIPDRQYAEVDYLQFRQGPALRIARAIAGALTWPLVFPLILVSRLSDMVFRTASELLSLVPYLLGVIVRGEFYRFTLRRCGTNVTVEFGSVFIYRDVAVGNHVLIGRYNVIHHCDLGSYVLTGERCTFLSGSRQHNFGRTDIPMALQGGKKKRIVIGDDCWIGAHAVIMEDVGRGAIVGAGAIVVQPIPDFTVAVGNPARPVRPRGAHEPA